MADKLSQQIVDALSRAAADPGGVPLLAVKAEPGLFPATAAGKPAAQKALADGLLAVVRTEAPGRAGRERYGLTAAGWDALLAAVNPKQVLEDFVRVLEARQGEVGELLAAARRMADGLDGLRAAVARVLPQVTAMRVAGGGREPPDPLRHQAAQAPRPPVSVADAVLARLSDWSGPAGQDCPLPELYHGLDGGPSVGAFHDALRELHAAGSVYLHPWTGPLYALPEPSLALLVGHGVCYYASLRGSEARGQRSEVGREPSCLRPASV